MSYEKSAEGAAGPRRWNKAAAYAHKCQRDWLDLVAMKEDRQAAAWGEVVDLLFKNEPRAAMRRVIIHGLPDSIVREIRHAFDLPPG